MPATTAIGNSAVKSYSHKPPPSPPRESTRLGKDTVAKADTEHKETRKLAKEEATSRAKTVETPEKETAPPPKKEGKGRLVDFAA